MKTIIEMAREAGLRSAVLLHVYGKESALCDSELEELEQIKWFAALVCADERERLLAGVEMPEPDAYLFQHEETGNTMFVDAQQVAWGFEKANPRLQKISGAYTADQLRETVAAAVAREREACAKVCDARYMGDNNREDMEAKRCADAIRARGKHD